MGPWIALSLERRGRNLVPKGQASAAERRDSFGRSKGAAAGAAGSCSTFEMKPDASAGAEPTRHPAHASRKAALWRGADLSAQSDPPANACAGAQDAVSLRERADAVLDHPDVAWVESGRPTGRGPSRRPRTKTMAATRSNARCFTGTHHRPYRLTWPRRRARSDLAAARRFDTRGHQSSVA